MDKVIFDVRRKMVLDFVEEKNYRPMKFKEFCMVFSVPKREKEEFKEFMEKKDFKGINVTIPYKKDVIPYLDEMDESAKAIGAVNTIINVDGKLKGFNTDFGGFLYMVKAHNVHMEGKKVLITVVHALLLKPFANTKAQKTL